MQAVFSICAHENAVDVTKTHYLSNGGDGEWTEVVHLTSESVFYQSSERLTSGQGHAKQGTVMKSSC